MIKLSISTFTLIFFCTLFYPLNVYADTATATQQVRIIIPKIALIDVSNTHKPLQIHFDPITNSGDNFSTATAIGTYDITSNISKLRLYGQTNIDLKNKHNLTLKVHEARSIYKTLTTSAQQVSLQSSQAQTNQPLTYQASPAFPNTTIPHGNINVTVTYTLVEP